MKTKDVEKASVFHLVNDGAFLRLCSTARCEQRGRYTYLE
jgi:hypothetical protein